MSRRFGIVYHGCDGLPFTTMNVTSLSYASTADIMARCRHWRLQYGLRIIRFGYATTEEASEMKAKKMVAVGYRREKSIIRSWFTAFAIIAVARRHTLSSIIVGYAG